MARRKETRLEQLQRLAEKGACEGVELWQAAEHEHIWHATSTSQARRMHTMTVYADQRGSCTCEGYRKHEACKHYALALMAAGIMPAPDWIATGNDPAA